MIRKLVKNLFKCRHKNAILYSSEGYCPDCGQYLKKSYYVVRCTCCGIKRTAKKNFDEIIPTEKFCTNCGEKEYVTEKYNTLNLVDINYAIEVKEAVEYGVQSEKIEIWIDENNEAPKKEQTNSPLLIGEMKYLGTVS